MYYNRIHIYYVHHHNETNLGPHLISNRTNIYILKKGGQYLKQGNYKLEIINGTIVLHSDIKLVLFGQLIQRTRIFHHII